MSAPQTAPEPSLLQEIVPAFDGGDRDTGQLHSENVKLVMDESALQWALRDLPPQEIDPKRLPKPRAGEQPKGSAIGRAAKDTGLGIVEAPVQAVGGVIDMENSALQLARDLSDGLPNPGLILDAEGVRFGGTEDVRAAEPLQLPTTPGAATATGAAIRSAAQFLSGFAGAGKLKPIQMLVARGTRGSAYAAQALKGAVADFAAFDASEQGLSNLIQQVPELANPITEFLAVEEDDPALVSRLKRTLDGAGVGVLTDSVLLGLKTVRASRRARTQLQDVAAQADREIKQIETTTAIQRDRFKELQGGAPSESLVKLGAAQTAEGASKDKADIFINWSRIDTADDIKAVLQKIADADAARIDTARRGRKRTFEQTKLDAETTNAWETLNSRRKGEPLNAEQSVAVRELWVRSGSHVLQMAQQVQAAPGDVAAAVAFRKALAVHATIQEQVIAARTETARALASWRIPVGETGLDFSAEMDSYSALLQHESGKTAALAEGVLNLSRKGQVAELDKFIYGSNWAKTAGAVRQLWYFSLLSGPHTHARNMLSQSAVLVQQMYERKVANLIGRAGGMDPAVADGEALAYLFGAIEGFKDAFRVGAKGRSAFKEALLTGRSSFGVGKLELPEMGALDPERLGMSRDTPLGRVLSYIDSGTRIPTRALAASDEVFKSIGYKAELHAQALRKATHELRAGKLTPEQFTDRLAELKTNQEESMMLAARLHAEDVTFSRNAQDSAIYGWMQKTQRVPVIGRLAMPFARTPYNIGNYVFKRTPLALAMKSVQADLKAGGARSDLAYSRMLTGTAILMTFGDMAMRGMITGEGPSNPAERETLMRTGWRPYSVKVGDQYFSYRGMEPVATSIGMAANVTEILSMADFGDENKDLDDLAIATTMAIANQVTSQQYMSGVAGLVEAMSDPQRYAEAFVNRTFGAVVPTGVAQINRALLDPVQREVVDAIDVQRSRTPGLSKNLPIKYDLWGRPISYGSHLGPLYDLLVPVYGSRDTTEPIDAELLRLGSPVGRPAKLVSFSGGVELNLENYPAAYSRYVQLAGNELKGADPLMPTDGALEVLNALVTGAHPMSPLYVRDTDGNDGGKSMRIRSYIQDFRDAAKELVLVEFPELAARVEALQHDRGSR